MSATSKTGEDFEDLYRKCLPWVRTLAGRIARQLDLDPDDVEQDFVVRLLAAFPNYDSTRGAYTTHIHWTAQSIYSGKLRQIQHRPRTVTGVFGPVEAEQPGPGYSLADPNAAPPDEILERAEITALVQAEVNNLPARYRDQVMRYFHMRHFPDHNRADEALVGRALRRLRMRLRVTQDEEEPHNNRAR